MILAYRSDHLLLRLSTHTNPITEIQYGASLRLKNESDGTPTTFEFEIHPPGGGALPYHDTHRVPPF